MYVDLFGYRIYWTVFALVFGLIALAFVLLRLRSYLKESKAVYSLSVITDWQKENIPGILRSYVEHLDDPDKILMLCNYIENNTYWNDEEILEIGEDVVMDATFIIINEIGKILAGGLNVKSKNRIVLLLVTLDFMNGSLDLSSGKIENWMDSAFQGGEVDGDEDLGKVWELYFNSIDRVGQQYIDKVLEGIPRITSAFDPLAGLKTEELLTALNDVIDAVKFSDLSERTVFILSCCLYDQIGSNLERYSENTVNNYYSSFFRAFAVLLDKASYPEIVSSIV